MSLDRFLAAQSPVYDTVVDELRAGEKRSHWIWFVFPQLKGLGRSPHADFFGLEDLEEARAYDAHPVLGARLRDCLHLLMSHAPRPAAAILGGLDALKLRSCLTLFVEAVPDEATYREAVQSLCQGERDARTLALLKLDGGQAQPP